MTHGNGALTSDEGAEPIVRLALQDGSPSGLFFSRGEEKSFRSTFNFSLKIKSLSKPVVF